ncbi:MAG TPA: cytochrome c biogenesis CcdA family protein [Patescibacteria group bacterium]|nr:cytochrome c biogenesis CcdA family protein [Patescibacteria group bacterium]
MEIFILASLLTAFLAGIAALFAPCCISVLLPSYLGSVFRERYKVLLMTGVFFLGILTVFLPIGLGFAALAEFFRAYHNTVFLAGGAFLTVLGLLILTKHSFALPFHIQTAPVAGTTTGSVYTLGIFSGITTTCCAPVLAGIIALSMLPGSLLWGGIYTLMYVFGMVAPLFFIALFLDKTSITKRIMEFRRPIRYVLFGHEIVLTIAEVLSGLVFLIMGVLTLYYAFTNTLTVHADYQLMINIYFAKLLEKVTAFLTTYESFVDGVLVLLLLYVLWKIYVFLFSYYKKNI